MPNKSPNMGTSDGEIQKNKMTDYIAIKNIKPAFEKTLKMLWPIKMNIWIKLALIATFALGVGTTEIDFLTDTLEKNKVGSQEMTIAAVIIGVILIFGIMMTLIASIFQFIHVKSLITQEIDIVKDFNEQSGRGYGIFLFKLILIALYFIAIMAIMVPTILILTIIENSFIQAFTIIIAVIIFIVLTIIIGVIEWITNSFVIPRIYFNNGYIMENLRHSMNVLMKKPGETIVYILVSICLGIFLGMLQFLILIPAVAGIIIMFFGAGVFFTEINPQWVSAYLDGGKTLTAQDLLTSAGIIIFMQIFAVLVGYLQNLLFLPVSTYLRYYSLLFWDEIDDEISLFSLKKEKNKEINNSVKVY